MPSLIGLRAALAMIAAATLLASASAPAAAHTTLVLEEGPEARVLESGAGFSLITRAPIMLETRDGSIECPYNADTADGILRGHDQTNGAAKDTVVFTGGLGSLGSKVQCTSTIPGFPGPVELYVDQVPWTGTLSTGGHIDLTGSPKVDFHVYDASFQCELAAATLKGTFNASLEATLAGKLKLAPGEGSAGCPRSATIHLSFQEAASLDGGEAAHRIVAVNRR